MNLWYLASPYSKYKDGHQAAADAIAEQAALLMEAGIEVFAPIVHTHPISQHTDASHLDHGFWLSRDLVFMSLSVGMIECRLDGWHESTGMAWEREWFESAGKQVIPMTPGAIPPELRRAA